MSTVLAQLPPEHLVFVLDGAWLVVGPTGVFVLGADDDPSVAAHRAVDRARAVRLRLADELAWVPFVDAVAVAGRGQQAEDLPCPLVPHDLLRSLIADAPRIVDDDTLAKLALIGFRRL